MVIPLKDVHRQTSIRLIFTFFGFSNFIQLLNSSTLLIFEQFKYYMSDLVSIHDHFVLLLLGGIYSVFGVIIMYQSGVVKKLNIFHQNAHLSISHGSHVSGRNFMVKLHFITWNYFLISIYTWQIFSQVILISAINAITASFYVYMQYNQTGKAMIIVAQFMWSQAHGCSLFNKLKRNSFFNTHVINNMNLYFLPTIFSI